jgi:hypothetical protein
MPTRLSHSLQPDPEELHVGPDGQRRRSSAASHADALRDSSARPDVFSSEPRNRVITAASTLAGPQIPARRSTCAEWRSPFAGTEHESQLRACLRQPIRSPLRSCSMTLHPRGTLREGAPQHNLGVDAVLPGARRRGSKTHCQRMFARRGRRVTRGQHWLIVRELRGLIADECTWTLRRKAESERCMKVTRQQSSTLGKPSCAFARRRTERDRNSRRAWRRPASARANFDARHDRARSVVRWKHPAARDAA